MIEEYDEYGRLYFDPEDDLYGVMSRDPDNYVERPEPDPGVGGDHNYDAWDAYGNRTHSNWGW